MTQRAKFWLYAISVILVLLVAAAFAGMHYGAIALKSKVQAALGPQGQVSEIEVHWTSVEAKGVILRAPANWPAKEGLRAERIVVVPDLFGLITGRLSVKSISVEGAYLALWRTRDGKLRLLPGLIDHPAAPAAPGTAAGAGSSVEIGEVVLKDSAIEFFDGTVTPVNHKIRLEEMNADAGPIQLPGLTGRTDLHMAGKIEGAQGGGHSDGSFGLDGWVELASKNSEITTTLKKVDLIPFQPYLLKAADTSVKSGTLDLQAKASVKQNQVHIPGNVVLNNLELGEGQGAFSTFMGLPRAAVVGAMKDRQGKIDVPFVIAGNLDDPQFSLNGGFAKQVGQTIAQSLGISVEGLVKGATEPASRLGSTLKNLLKSH